MTLDNAIGLPYTYPLDRDLSDGYQSPAFKQLAPEVYLDFPSNLIGKLTINFSTGQSWSDLNLGPQVGTQNKDFGAVLQMDFNKSLVSSLVQAQFFPCVVNWSCEKK